MCCILKGNNLVSKGTMSPKACTLSQCRNGIIMEKNRASIQFNYPNCITNVKEEIVCIPKRSFPLFPFPPHLEPTLESTWSPADYNGAFVLRKLARFIPCRLFSYLLNPSSSYMINTLELVRLYSSTW